MTALLVAGAVAAAVAALGLAAFPAIGLRTVIGPDRAERHVMFFCSLGSSALFGLAAFLVWVAAR